MLLSRALADPRHANCDPGHPTVPGLTRDLPVSDPYTYESPDQVRGGRDGKGCLQTDEEKLKMRFSAA